MTVKEKTSALLKQLREGIYEKEEVLALALLSSLAGESIFLLGPPGVAKSLIARRLKYAYKGAAVFEYLMSRFSTPDEIFGPVSISKLKGEDKYERITDGYLPAAGVVFLDEIWKAGPSIQNALLTALNEKVYRNGAEEIRLPMKALISASNELPAEDAGLEALWDRFLVRLMVGGIADRKNFDAMIAMPSASFPADSVTETITDEDYQQWSAAIDTIAIPENVYEVIHVIRNYLDLHNGKPENAKNQIYVSDRRWRKIVRLLRTSAFLNGREAVDLMDCFLIKHCIWNNNTQIQTVSCFVNDAVEKYGYTVSFDLDGIRKELKDFQTEIDEETKFVKDTRVEVLESVYIVYYEILNPPQQNANLINQDHFESLTNQNQHIYLYYWHQSYQRVQQNNAVYMRKGNSKFSLFINDKEYTLKTTTQGEIRQLTKKPHPSVERDWDYRVAAYLKQTEEIKKQIEQSRNKDLEHIRVNLFVKPALANIVESHITTTLKDIEKIELVIRDIQHGYKRLKDEVKASKNLADSNLSDNNSLSLLLMKSTRGV